jgi:hypothetical protein
MFTDEELEEAQIIADGLLDGDPEVFQGVAQELARMIKEKDLESVPAVMAVFACLLPHEVQSRIRFGVS